MRRGTAKIERKENLCVKVESGKRTEKRRWRFVGWLVGGLATVIYFLAAVGRSVAAWMDETYGVSFDQLLYVLASPLKGTGQDVVETCMDACLPAVQEAAVQLRHVRLLDEIETMGEDGCKREYCPLYTKDFLFPIATLRLAHIFASDMTYTTLMYLGPSGTNEYEP